jgi:two-component system CheB/CheR fusion protein
LDAQATIKKSASLRRSKAAMGENAVQTWRKSSVRVTTATMPVATTDPSFSIVGIGASAGGLVALESLLRHLPDNSGLAFVVVQHSDPTHKGMLVDLLSRATPMKVLQVKDRLKVEPDRVYVIPPNKDLSILHGVLHLLEPVAPRRLRRFVEIYLRGDGVTGGWIAHRPSLE